MSSAPQPPVRDSSKHYDFEELESIFRTIKAEKARSSKRPQLGARPDNGRPQRPVYLPHAALDHNPSALHAGYVATNRAAHRRPAGEGVRPVVGVNTRTIERTKYRFTGHGTTARVQDPTGSRGPSQRYQELSSAQEALSVDSDAAPPAILPVAPSASREENITSQANSADPHANSQRPSMVKPPSRPPCRTGATISSQSNDFIRYYDHQLQHSTDNVNWHPAVKYADIRDGMLGRAKRGSRYTFRQVRGISNGDETAPVKGHESWGGARNNRPDELFQLFEPQGGIQPAGQRRGMIVGKRRVLDRDNKWMSHWDGVPVTCCSLIEGWHLEALMRRNPDLTIADIQARMMDTFDYQVKEGVIRARGPYGLTTLTNRTMRFRWESFNVTWRTIGEGSSDIWAYIQSILPQPFIAANSTRGYRDMNDLEQAGLRRHLADCHQRRKAKKQAMVVDDDGQSTGTQAGLPSAQTPVVSSSHPIGTAANSTKRKVQELIEISDDEDDEAAPPAPKRQRIMPGAQTALDKVDRTLPAPQDVYLLDARSINGVKRARGDEDELKYNGADHRGPSFKRPRLNDGAAQPPITAGRVRTTDQLPVSSSGHGQPLNHAQRSGNNHYAVDRSLSRVKAAPTNNINGISRAYRRVPVTPRQPPPLMVAPHTEAHNQRLPSTTMNNQWNSDYYGPNNSLFTTKPFQTVKVDFDANSVIPPKDSTTTRVEEQPNQVMAIQVAAPSNIETSTPLSTTPATEKLCEDTQTYVAKSAESNSGFVSTPPQEPQEGEVVGYAIGIPEENISAAIDVIAPSPSHKPVELDSTSSRASSGLSSPVSDAALATLAEEAASRVSPSHSVEDLLVELSEPEESQPHSPAPIESDDAQSAEDDNYTSSSPDQHAASASLSPQSSAEHGAEELPEPPQAPARYNTRSRARAALVTESVDSTHSGSGSDSDGIFVFSSGEMQAMRMEIDAENALLWEKLAAGRREIEDNDRELHRLALQHSSQIIGENLFDDNFGFDIAEIDTRVMDEYDQGLGHDVSGEEFAGVYNPGFGYNYQLQGCYEGITPGEIAMAHELVALDDSLYPSLQ